MLRVIIPLMLLSSVTAYAQNVGIGTTNPKEKLEVSGNIKSNGLVLPVGGAYDFLMQLNGSGQVGARKGYGALALHYIICIYGSFPGRSGSGGDSAVSPFLGEIKLFAGNYVPAGWMFCEGQLLPIAPNQALFAIMGTTFGGNGVNNFAIPDLRGAVPVHTGTSPAGYTWNWADRSF